MPDNEFETNQNTELQNKPEEAAEQPAPVSNTVEAAAAEARTPEAKPKKSRKFVWILKAFGYFALYYGILLAVNFAAEFVYAFGYVMNSGSELDFDALMTYVIDAIYSNAMTITIISDIFVAAVFALFILLTKRSPAREDNRGLFTKISAGSILTCFFMGFCANGTLTIAINLLSLTGIIPDSLLENYSQTTTVYTAGGIVPYIIGGIILAPIIEELVFRGFMVTRMRHALPAWLSVIFAGIIFGVFHGNVFQAIYASLLGFMLGAVFVKYNSIYASVLCHFGFNLVSLPPYLVALYGKSLAENAVYNTVYEAVAYISVPVFIALLFVCFFMPKKKAVGGDDLSPMNE